MLSVKVHPSTLLGLHRAPPDLVRPEGKPSQGLVLGGPDHLQLAWPSGQGTGSRTLLGAAGPFSRCVAKGGSCLCPLAEGQERAKVLPPAQAAPEPSLALNSLTLRGQWEGWSEGTSDLPGRMDLLMLCWAET